MIRNLNYKEANTYTVNFNRTNAEADASGRTERQHGIRKQKNK